MRPLWVTEPKPGQLFREVDGGSLCVRFIRFDEQGLMSFRVEKDPDDMGDTCLFDTLAGARFEVDFSTWHDGAWYVVRPVDTGGDE